MERQGIAQVPRRQVAVHAAWITAVSTLGFLVSTQARAALVPPLPVPAPTVPGITTVALPPVNTGPTPTATTAAGPPEPGPAATTAAPAGGAAPATRATETTEAASSAAPAGTRRLAGGAVSIPVSSVRAPARLRVLLSFAPTTLRTSRQRISVRARIVDTRGYVVRGARVTLAFTPARTLYRTGAKVSAVDGLVAFVLRQRIVPARHGSLVLTVLAVDPAAAKLAAARQRIRIPILVTR